MLPLATAAGGNPGNNRMATATVASPRQWAGILHSLQNPFCTILFFRYLELSQDRVKEDV